MTQIKQKFYPLTAEISQKLRDSKLTAAEWRLWSYLVELDPFGDRYSDLPDTLTIMQAVDIKKTTFYTGQILIYSGFYPNHKKRIHLFGNLSQLSRIADIEASCLEFDIKVTGEEV